MATCEGCGAQIVWRFAEGTGRRAPINAEPDPKGNIMVVRDTGAYRVLTKQAMADMEGTLFEQAVRNDRYTSHFATCPKAEHFKRCGKCHKTPCVCRGKQP